MTNTDFQAICKGNAERFLKTAFLLDDEVVFDDTSSRPQEVIDPALTKLTRVPLKGQVLTQSFLRKGISCSILKPRKDEMDSEVLNSSIIDVIQNVDLPILDWDIHDDDGIWVIAILKRLIDEYHYPEGRVALILIYTEHNAEDVYDNLLKGLRDSVDGVEADSESSLLLTIGGLRILVARRDEAMDEEQLPDYLTEEFSKIHRGILENGVIQAIADIREKTYHVLHRFPKELDAPFISHRAAQDIPDDAGNHVFDCITSEIHSLLSQSDLPERINQATIQQISQDISSLDLNSVLKNDCPDDKKPIIRDELQDLLKNGIEPTNRFTVLFGGACTSLSSSTKDKQRKQLISALTKLLERDNTSALDAKFSELMTFQHKYPGFSPQLSLGTIVYKPEGQWAKSYYVCVMPVCDCEHLTDPVSFPFLPLDLPTSRNRSFHLTFSHNNVRKEFRINYSIEDIKPFKFEPTSTSGGKILARNNIFSTVGGAKLEWIGSFKREFAQRIANQFGSEISQVGLNDSEWQRLSAK